jgi:hypothetical protein
MEDLRYPLDAIELVGNIYTNSTTIYTNEYFGQIKPIHIQRSTIQGDILSPYLFILFLEPLLRWLQRDQLGYTFNTSKIHESVVAYADNLALLTNNIKALQSQINKIQKFNMWVGMDLSIINCAITGAPHK